MAGNVKKLLVVAVAAAGAGLSAWRAVAAQRADADLWHKATDKI